MREYTIPIESLNKIALLLLLPVAIVLLVPFVLINGFEAVSLSGLTFKHVAGGTLLFIAVFIAGGILHELLHGLTWSLFTNKGLKAISYGIKWEYLTPYCHCNEPLKKWHFMLGATMPFLVLGIVPLIWAYIGGSFKVWFFGYFFSMAALGDLAAVKLLWKLPSSAKIQDHPSEMGFIVDNGIE